MTSPASRARGGRRADEGREPGEEEQDRTELVDRHHPPRERMDVHPDATPADLEHREVAGHEEADAAEDVGEPDPSVGLAGGEPLGEGRDEADREQQRSDEQHDGAQPVAPLRLVAPPPHARSARCRRRRAGVDDEQDRRVAAEAEEEATDQVGDVDRQQGADPELGEDRAQGEEAAAEEEGHGRDEVDRREPCRLGRGRRLSRHLPTRRIDVDRLVLGSHGREDGLPVGRHADHRPPQPGADLRDRLRLGERSRRGSRRRTRARRRRGRPAGRGSGPAPAAAHSSISRSPPEFPADEERAAAELALDVAHLGGALVGPAGDGDRS